MIVEKKPRFVRQLSGILKYISGDKKSAAIKFEKDLTGNIIALTSNNGVVTFVGDVSGKTQNILGNIGN